MASERRGSSFWAAAQASTLPMNSSESRNVREGALPVAGRPRLLGIAFFVDCLFKIQSLKPVGKTGAPPRFGKPPRRAWPKPRGEVMAQVNPENPTSIPVDQPRRRFLPQAAGVPAGGAVLALATIPPASA